MFRVLHNFSAWCWLLAMVAFNGTHAQPSVLQSGTWHKLSVASDGIYKIDATLLQKLGVNPGQIDPRNIRLYGFPTGMLPQSNLAPRANGLQELGIFVSGESDGKFDAGDYILFFGQGPDRYSYNTDATCWFYENNLYSDENFYFLTIGDAVGKRIPLYAPPQGTFPLVDEYMALVQYEQDKYNILNSGRQWYGVAFDASTTASVGFSMEGILPGRTARLVSDVMSRSSESASFSVYWNGNLVGEQSLNAVPVTQYGIKGLHRADTFLINTTAVRGEQVKDQVIKYVFNRSTGTGYLDRFLISVPRKLALYEHYTQFTAPTSLAQSTSTFQINGMATPDQVWDVTDPFAPVSMAFSLNGTTATFSATTETLRTFAVFSPTGVITPTPIGPVLNQQLGSIEQADLLIITAPAFQTAANRLAQHRTTHDGMVTAVVTTEEIYNEYSGGRQDVTAIRDFIRQVYLKSAKNLTNVLLLGRGTYDYKDRIFNNSNYLPIYESRNSLSPLETYASDDYFVMMDDLEGTWTESYTDHSTIDIGIGRLSVRTEEEAMTWVDKLIEYDKPENWGSWLREFVFAADDGDNNIHQKQANQLADTLEARHPAMHAKRIYVDQFHQIERPSGQQSPEAHNTLVQKINEGAVVVNFTGHGSEELWTQERMFDLFTLDQLKNQTRYPLFVTATCEFGRHDDPLIISYAERLALLKHNGAIGLVTTARPVNTFDNFSLNTAFYRALFTLNGRRYRTLGEIFRETKNNSINGVANRNFSLLGDPSMRLMLPEGDVVFTSLTNEEGTDTLKALSTYTISGMVVDPDGVVGNLNGIGELTVYGAAQSYKTRGDENPPFAYHQWDDLLYQGQAEVNEGQFTATFHGNSSISQSITNGKITFHFKGSAGTAAGTSQPLRIGGKAPVTMPDKQGPSIALFINDTTFIDGGLTHDHPTLIVQLADPQGVNISRTEPTQQLVAILDNDSTFFIGNHYVGAVSGISGTIRFGLIGIPAGNHQLTVFAWDNAGNGRSETIHFMVSEGGGLELGEWYGYPNPFQNTVQLEFTHNKAGSSLSAQIVITDMAGRLIRTFDSQLESTLFRQPVAEWDGTDVQGSKLRAGIYLIQVTIRSLEDGSASRKIAKLVLLD